MRSSSEHRRPPCEGPLSPSQRSFIVGPNNLAKGYTNLRKVPRRGHAGFTLLEVIVSIAILGGVITALMVARSRAQETHLIAAQILTATRLAGSQAALVRAGALGVGEGQFKEPSGYSWRVTAFPAAEGGPKDLRMYDLRVWPETHEEEAAVTLHVWALDQTVEVAP